ncbi:NUDIX hydrolase [Bacillus manliponensis]|uniref:NUDIX hydrolase n=1 Tax=Bacillus manliponensis TaxID=574376 RepID=A0A073JW43_9BACI|nr:NUDIX domain-containing protein [Bacillus manliponensis]KEK18500.1 NUDIX hydrolase [Bacillus manliponensis]
MEQELLAIFDEKRNRIGTATREEVHKIGYWHETFHCWFISVEEDGIYVHLQIRSDKKKDYPNLLDITAAGHILANETVHDGIREVHEEVGIHVQFDELVSLGVIPYAVKMGEFIDKELAHVFLYENKQPMDVYNVQVEEVSGVVKVSYESFAELWYGNRDTVCIEGFEVNEQGERIAICKTVDRSAFVPHERAYYINIIEKIREGNI